MQGSFTHFLAFFSWSTWNALPARWGRDESPGRGGVVLVPGASATSKPAAGSPSIQPQLTLVALHHQPRLRHRAEAAAAAAVARRELSAGSSRSGGRPLADHSRAAGSMEACQGAAGRPRVPGKEQRAAERDSWEAGAEPL